MQRSLRRRDRNPVFRNITLQSDDYDPQSSVVLGIFQILIGLAFISFYFALVIRTPTLCRQVPTHWYGSLVILAGSLGVSARDKTHWKMNTNTTTAEPTVNQTMGNKKIVLIFLYFLEMVVAIVASSYACCKCKGSNESQILFDEGVIEEPIICPTAYVTPPRTPTQSSSLIPDKDTDRLLKKSILKHFAQIVNEVNVDGTIMDNLVGSEILSLEWLNNIQKKGRRDQTRTLLDNAHQSSSHPQAGINFLKALMINYPYIAENILQDLQEPPPVTNDQQESLVNTV